MTFEELLMNYWHLNIPALIIIIVLITFHFISNGRRFTTKSINFFIGIFLFAILMFSPLDFFGHYYLFSAHMIQHIVLLLIIPPLLLTGTNKDFLQKLFDRPRLQKFGNFLFYPITAWMVGVGSMWIWHAPLLFMGMMKYPIVHIIEIISLLTFGLIFAWPVFSPIGMRKLVPLEGALFLFTACIGCTILGIFITFAPAGFYSAYMTGNNPAILNFLHNNMGLTPDVDQQAAGLIMWVPACLIYLTIILIIMAKWYSKPEEERNEEMKSDHLNLR
jgi:cytochrome c oxidase assembly factor CtaG